MLTIILAYMAGAIGLAVGGTFPIPRTFSIELLHQSLQSNDLLIRLCIKLEMFTANGCRRLCQRRRKSVRNTVTSLYTYYTANSILP